MRACSLADVINPEIEKVNSHVVACLGALESAGLLPIASSCAARLIAVAWSPLSTATATLLSFRVLVDFVIILYHTAVSQSLRQ